MKRGKMREQLLGLIQKDGILPPFPEIINRLREMIEDPDTGINDVAKVIQSDPVLAGRLIHLANSVFGSSSVFFATELTRALSRLGLKMAMDLAYSLKMPHLFKDNVIIDQRLFWRHSLALGIMSSKVAKLLGATPEQVSHAYLGGLMRKTGVLLFANLIPEQYEAFLEKVENVLKKQLSNDRRSIGLFNLGPLETKLFGIDNAELGAAFMRRWWSVDPEVINYVQFRPTGVKKDLEHVTEIARYILCAEGIPDGLMSVQGTLTPEYVQNKIGFSVEEYNLLTEDFSEDLNAFA
jgi:HD-like signal output (HDOD) protein